MRARPYASAGKRLLVVAAAALIAGFSAIQAAETKPQPAPGLAPPASATQAATAGQPDGAALYAARCAGCHDNASDRTPGREVLARNPPSFILATLRNGTMAPMAAGLSHAEMTAIARHVSTPAPA